ncbi:hypothetical protein ACQ4M4_21795 [Leptolyngbya sp. AN02str]|uniref:hypothetical protein n=1 Tax=Leptolyngbya sp. AN02str TaxID=3423363 RepID=UPI003D31234D
MPVVFDEVVGTVVAPPTPAEASPTAQAAPSTPPSEQIRQQSLHWLQRQRRLKAD